MKEFRSLNVDNLNDEDVVFVNVKQGNVYKIYVQHSTDHVTCNARLSIINEDEMTEEDPVWVSITNLRINTELRAIQVSKDQSIISMQPLELGIITRIELYEAEV